MHRREGELPPAGAAPEAADLQSVDMRRYARERARRRGVLVHAGTGAACACEILDRSPGGAGLLLLGPLEDETGLSLFDRSQGTAHEITVAWRDGERVGVSFTSTTRLP